MPCRPHVPPLAVVLTAKPRDISARSICFGNRFDAHTLSVLREIAAANPDLYLNLVADGAAWLGGPDEASLDQAIDEARARGSTPLAVGAPQVGYVEAILSRVEKDYTHKKQAADEASFARIKLVLEPGEDGLVFESRIVGGAVPEPFVRAVDGAIAAVGRAGPRQGFPVIATRVTLIDGAYHDQDSSTSAFETAARDAFREALVEAGGLLEPIMRVEVRAPEVYHGGIVGDARSRRGTIEGHAVRDGMLVVQATVPLANLLGYGNDLRSLTQGHGSYVARFERYDAVPTRPPEPPPAMAAALRRPR